MVKQHTLVKVGVGGAYKFGKRGKLFCLEGILLGRATYCFGEGMNIWKKGRIVLLEKGSCWGKATYCFWCGVRGEYLERELNCFVWEGKEYC